jgi:electron transfer flavoprotein alpha/beta subunit
VTATQGKKKTATVLTIAPTEEYQSLRTDEDALAAGADKTQTCNSILATAAATWILAQ